MKKLRTTKPIPAVPVGTELFEKQDHTFHTHDCISGGWTIEELEGFVEEVKDPEEFYFLHPYGHICSSETPGSCNVPKYFCFRTKESAEKFAKALKDSKGKHEDVVLAILRFTMFEALNDRVK